MKNNLRTGLVLSIFALLCGFLLALVNYFTAPVIEARNEQDIKDAIQEICPEYDTSIHTLTTYDNLEYVEKAYIISSTSTKEKLYAIYLVSETGFASTIEMMICVDKNDSIVGYTVISSAETKGDIKAHDFNMNGSSSLDDFDSLAGSTHSSDAVKKCFKVALLRAKSDL